MQTFKAIGASGGTVILHFAPGGHDGLPSNWRDGRAYMVTLGAAAYLVDPDTGHCEGTEGSTGHKLQLRPNALRRLRKLRPSDGSGIVSQRSKGAMKKPPTHLVKWNRGVNRGGEKVYVSKCGRFTITLRRFANLSGRAGHFGQKGYVFVAPSDSKRYTCDTLDEAKLYADWEIDPNFEPPVK